MNYFRLLIWKPKDDDEVRTAYQAVMGRPLMIKRPQKDRLTGKLMVGTGMMTEEKEEKLKKLLGARIDIREKEPKLWWKIDG